MTSKQFAALRERCLNLVKEELQKNYGTEMLDDFVYLVLQHRVLPCAPLVVQSYKGIIGYYYWSQLKKWNPGIFVETALHDLCECQQYARNDGYSPRTSEYIRFYQENYS